MVWCKVKPIMIISDFGMQISDLGFGISDSGYLFHNPQSKIRNRSEGELGEANPQSAVIRQFRINITPVIKF